jgi:hypothetical protein
MLLDKPGAPDNGRGNDAWITGCSLPEHCGETAAEHECLELEYRVK